ncbi:MAG TPA: hypothetical protein VFA77_02400 [Candidatus Eisenbacteria bacterium]|nr:hypothetical protein [Candidatus Eisenbacteria bacterium]
MKTRPWYALWQVWLCLFIMGTAWVVGMPLRVLEWLISILR